MTSVTKPVRGLWLPSAACLLLAFAATAATAASAQTQPNLDVVPSARDLPACTGDQHPTGCLAPFASCAVGTLDLTLLDNVIFSCEGEAVAPRCPNFTWEKCCFVSCYALGGQTASAPYQGCIENCMNTPDAQIFWKSTVFPSPSSRQ